MLFQAAIDTRVQFACSSGAAGTYRQKVANEIGIDRAEIIPGVINHFDIDDLTRLVAPRHLFIVAGQDDRYAFDVAEIAESTRAAYQAPGSPQALSTEIFPGGHSMTPERQVAITAWITATAVAAGFEG